MLLGNLEYMQAVMNISNTDQKYRELAKGQFETYTLVIEAEPDKGVMETKIVGFDCRDGEFMEVWQGSRPTMFTLSAPYRVWVDILRGRMGPTKALTMRKLRAQGNFLQILKGANRIIRWVQLLQTIPTEFEGEFAKDNITVVEAAPIQPA